jgi:protein-L-isoaspartate(D-aspartate) O-methyltransferase
MRLLAFLLLFSCELKSMENEKKYSILRKQMLDVIRVYGVRDSKVLAAMEKIPRHDFVPRELRDMSYEDGPLPIGEGQTISQPFIVAYMTEKLDVRPTSKVLEIGTGSGYQAAVLGELAKEVYTIEIVESLCKKAKEIIKNKNVHVFCGDGYGGLPKEAPFDRIILTAAPDKIPGPLLDQLAKGGLLIAPVGKFFQELQRIEKDQAGQIIKQDLIPVRFVPMTGKALKE